MIRTACLLISFAATLWCSAQEVTFKLVVYDKMNREPIVGAEVKLQDVVSLREYKQLSNDSGYVFVKILPNNRYRLDVSKNSTGSSTGYMSYNYMLSEKEVASGKAFEAELEKIKHNDSGLLPAMYFEYGRSILSDENKDDLNNALKMLKSFPTLQIEIGVYADCREPADMVSQRARGIVDYLAQNGESKRVIVKEYGNVRALNQCDCSSKYITCSEEKYLENRRAEFKVISF